MATPAKSLIFGFGVSGQSIARHLGRLGQRALISDDNPERLEACTGKEYAHCEALPVDKLLELLKGGKALAGVDKLYTSPGIHPRHPLLERARERAIAIGTDIELFYQSVDKPVIAVTGTNGKSTVVSLMKRLLNDHGIAAACCGNIGTPALDVLGQPGVERYVVELSSFQLHYARPGPMNHVGVLCNISSDHLDFHGDMQSYIAAKRRVFAHNRFSVYCRDQAQCRLPATADRVGFGQGRCARDGDFGLLRTEAGLRLMHGNRTIHDFGKTLDRPLCFILDLMPALAVLGWLGIEVSAAVGKALSHPMLAHRYERIDSADGIDWIDASKATNPAAAVACLPENLARTIVLIGGNSKGVDLSMMRPRLRGAKRLVVYAGEAGATAQSLGDSAEVSVCEGLEAAVALSGQCAESGDTVLLAPAAASQPRYRDYSERARHFAELVRALPAPGQRRAV